jgi:hypothetical protein
MPLDVNLMSEERGIDTEAPRAVACRIFNAVNGDAVRLEFLDDDGAVICWYGSTNSDMRDFANHIISITKPFN